MDSSLALSDGELSCIGPALPPHTALAVSYHTLGNQLTRSGMGKLSGDWHERALNTALKYDVDITVVDLLRDYLDDSRSDRNRHQSFNNNGNHQTNQTNYTNSSPVTNNLS